jgi:hypothetical protein
MTRSTTPAQAPATRTSWPRALGGAAALSLVSWTGGAAPAQADILVQTHVEYMRGSQVLSPLDYPELYAPERNSARIDTRLQGNALEQLIDAVEFASAFSGIRDGGILGTMLGGPAAVGFQAYNAWNAVEQAGQLAAGWGGRYEFKEARVRVRYPHPHYDRLRIRFVADSDDDRFSSPESGPRASTALGITRRTYFPTNRRGASVTYEVDLAKLAANMRTDVLYRDLPFFFAIREDPNDTVISNLRVTHTLKLRLTRVEEAPPVITTSVSYWNGLSGNEGIGTPVGGTTLMSFAPWASASNPGFGDLVQSATLPLLRGARGGFELYSFPAAKRYEYVIVSFRYASSRVSYGGASPYRITAELAGSARPLALTPAVRQIQRVQQRDSRGRTYWTEGFGMASLAFRPDGLAPGTYPVVFAVVDASGRAVAQQMVSVAVGRSPQGGAGGSN